MITPLAGRVRSGQATATANINIMLHSTISTLTFTSWISLTPHSTSPTSPGHITSTSHHVSSDTGVGGHSVQWSSVHGLHIIGYHHSIGLNRQVRAGSGADCKKTHIKHQFYTLGRYRGSEQMIVRYKNNMLSTLTRENFIYALTFTSGSLSAAPLYCTLITDDG